MFYDVMAALRCFRVFFVYQAAKVGSKRKTGGGRQEPSNNKSMGRGGRGSGK